MGSLPDDLNLDELDGLLDDQSASEFMIGDLDVSLSIEARKGPDSPQSLESWRLANAVHMEMQENAKLPTFHWTVDRTGSVVFCRNSESPIDNLMERLLSSESRAGKQANYAHAGVLKQDTTQRIVDEQQVTLDLDPTPLDEIKLRHEPGIASFRPVPLPLPEAAVDEVTNAATGKQPVPSHSEGYLKLKPALQSASQQHSQYGFGRKHTVPSVPAASQRTAAAKRPSSRGNPKGSSPKSQSLDDETVNSRNSNMGDAYERKKQRAKTSRVKLNEAIERLAVAINLAGTQSKQRSTVVQQLLTKSTKASAGGTMRIIQDCVKTAEDAKKWDRPSFVGSAAKLIQGLNDQCEAMTRELQFLHDEMHRQRQENGKHCCGKNGTNGISYPASPSNKRRRINGQKDESLVDELQSLRASSTEADTIIFADRKIMDRVASFLEPPSVVRCMRVSKAWKEWGVFSNDDLWENLAVQRFGFYNVRQWRVKLGDDVSATTLYRTMDASNVMPHFATDALLFLGEARLSCKVSAWAFLVERSNGETLRSVLRHPDSSGRGIFSSIPVVQLRIVLQNTGIHEEALVLREQTVTVDASTRRRGEEMGEVDWDERFYKRVSYLDGSVPPTVYGELCRLRLFETAVLECSIYAKSCSTASKFVQRSNFTKVLVQIRDRTTVPVVIPFPRDASHRLV